MSSTPQRGMSSSMDMKPRIDFFLDMLCSTQHEKSLTQQHILKSLSKINEAYHISTPQAATPSQSSSTTQSTVHNQSEESLQAVHQQLKDLDIQALQQTFQAGQQQQHSSLSSFEQPLLPGLSSPHDFMLSQSSSSSNVLSSLPSSISRHVSTISTSLKDTPLSSPVRSNDVPTASPLSTAAISTNNILWVMNRSSILGIDLMSIIESPFTNSIRCVRAEITLDSIDGQRPVCDLSQYNGFLVNQISTLGVIFAQNMPSTTALPLVISLPTLATISFPESFNFNDRSSFHSLTHLFTPASEVLCPSFLLVEFETLHSISDIIFHPYSPTSILLLSHASLYLFTIFANQRTTRPIPSLFLPITLSKQQASFQPTTQIYQPTTCYDLRTLPYTHVNPTTTTTYSSSNSPQWIKIVHIPAQQPSEESTLVQDENATTSHVSTTTPTPTPNDSSSQWSSSLSSLLIHTPPPISFSFCLLSQTGQLAILSPIIPHMCYIPTSLLLHYRAWLVSQAFPSLIDQVEQLFRDQFPSYFTSITQNLPPIQPFAPLPSAATLPRATRFLAALAQIDLVFGLTPFSPFPVDALERLHEQTRDEIAAILLQRRELITQPATSQIAPGVIAQLNRQILISLLSPCTVIPSVSEFVLSDIISSKCVTQCPILQYVGNISDYFVQYMASSAQINLASASPSSSSSSDNCISETFVDMKLLHSSLPVLVITGIVSNKHVPLPEAFAQSQQNTSQSSKSALYRVQIHHVELSAALAIPPSFADQHLHIKRAQLPTPHILAPYIYAPAAFFASIDNNYDNYTHLLHTLAQINAGPSTSSSKSSSIRGADTTLSRLTKLSQVTAVAALASTSFQPNVSTSLSPHQQTNTTTVDIIPSLSNRALTPLSVFPATAGKSKSALASLFPLLTQTGLVKGLTTMKSVGPSIITYISPSFSFIYLPESLTKLKCLHLTAQQCLLAVLLGYDGENPTSTAPAVAPSPSHPSSSTMSKTSSRHLPYKFNLTDSEPQRTPGDTPNPAFLPPITPAGPATASSSSAVFSPLSSTSQPTASTSARVTLPQIFAATDLPQFIQHHSPLSYVQSQLFAQLGELLSQFAVFLRQKQLAAIQLEISTQLLPRFLYPQQLADPTICHTSVSTIHRLQPFMQEHSPYLHFSTICTHTVHLPSFASILTPRLLQAFIISKYKQQCQQKQTTNSSSTNLPLLYTNVVLFSLFVKSVVYLLGHLHGPSPTHSIAMSSMAIVDNRVLTRYLLSAQLPQSIAKQPHFCHLLQQQESKSSVGGVQPNTIVTPISLSYSQQALLSPCEFPLLMLQQPTSLRDATSQAAHQPSQFSLCLPIPLSFSPAFLRSLSSLETQDTIPHRTNVSYGNDPTSLFPESTSSAIPTEPTPLCTVGILRTLGPDAIASASSVVTAATGHDLPSCPITGRLASALPPLPVEIFTQYANQFFSRVLYAEEQQLIVSNSSTTTSTTTTNTNNHDESNRHRTERVSDDTQDDPIATLEDVIEVLNDDYADIIETFDTLYQQHVENESPQAPLQQQQQQQSKSPSLPQDVPVVQNIDEFLTRYAAQPSSSSNQPQRDGTKFNPFISLSRRIADIISSTITESDLEEVADRILIIQLDCTAIKIELQCRAKLLATLSNSNANFADYLLHYFVSLEAFHQHTNSQYAHIKTVHHMYRKKLQLLTEKAVQLQGKRAILPPGQTLEDDPEADATGTSRSPIATANVAVLAQQLVALQEKIQLMESEMQSINQQQQTLLVQEQELFGISMGITNNDPEEASSWESISATKATFQNVICDLANVYDTLVGYSVRIKSAQEELEQVE